MQASLCDIFYTIRDMKSSEPILTIHYSAQEVHQSSLYRFENHERPTSPPNCVIQRTISGRAFIDYGGKRHFANVGQAMVFMHGDNSTYGYPPAETIPYHTEYIAIGGTLAIPIFRSLIEHVGPVIPIPVGSRLASQFERFVVHKTDIALLDRFELSARLYDLLMSCFQIHSAGEQETDPILAAREYILNHFKVPFSLSELAEKVGLSREHLSRSFHQRYGETLSHFLQQHRMQHARLLLKSSPVSIEEIALQCGFTNQNSFSRGFRAFHQTNPLSFRKNKQAAASIDNHAQ